MNTIGLVVKLYTRGKLIVFFAPWLVLLLQFVAALIVIFIVERFVGGTTPFYPGGLITIGVVMFVWGMMSLAETFPFALGFGVRRTDYVLGTTVMAVELSMVMAALWLLCSLFETMTGGWGIGLHYFHLPYVNDGPLIEQFWVYFMILANLYFLGFAIGSFSQRFGRVGTLLFVLTALLLLSLFALVWTSLRWWAAFFAWFSQFSAFELALLLLPVTVLYLLASYLLLRRAVA